MTLAEINQIIQEHKTEDKTQKDQEIEKTREELKKLGIIHI